MRMSPRAPAELGLSFLERRAMVMGMKTAVLITAVLGAQVAGGLAQTDGNSNWQILFDGKFPYHFRGYKLPAFPYNSWGVWAGQIMTVPSGERSDLLIREPYTNFEFAVEWRVAPGGESGIVYLANEGPAKAFQAGLKMVLANDANLPDDRKRRLYQLGALYSLLPAENAKSKPPGQWNEARILVNTNHVEHWINDQRVLEFELGGERLTNAIEEYISRDLPAFGEARSGFIILEHNGASAWFRNPRIRILPNPPPPAEETPPYRESNGN